MVLKRTRYFAILLFLGILFIVAGCGADADLQDGGTGDKKPVYVSEINLAAKGFNLASVNWDALLLSPDGKFAAFSAFESPKDNASMPEFQLVLANLYTGDVLSLDRDEDLQVLEWFPDSKKILYRKMDNLFVVDITSDKPAKVAGGTYYGTISPDGEKLAYAAQQKGIFVANADGSNKKQVTGKPGDWYPVWYPDGQSLFYFPDLGVTLTDGAGQLQGLGKVNIETGETTYFLGNEKGKYRSAEWLIPGKTLYIDKGWDDGFFEMLVDLEKGEILELGENYMRMEYSTAVDRANGLLYKAGHDEVIIYDALGREKGKFAFEKPVEGMTLTNHGYSASPDGRKLAYLYGENGFIEKGRKIYTCDTNGANDREETPRPAYYTPPVWTPDSSHLVTVENTGQGQQGATNLIIRIIPVQ